MWTRELREIDNAIQIPVDNYQSATLATIKHRSDIIESVDDNDEIELTENPFEYKPQPATTGSSMIDLIKINGPPSLQRKLRALCEEYSDIFDTTVRAESADIPIMSIKIDERNGSLTNTDYPLVEKQSQIRQQCDQLLELEVFRHSMANEWSLVHRVPKPTIVHPI